MQINYTFGAGVPEGEQQAVATACNYYDNLFTNNVTVDLQFNYAGLPSGSVSQQQSMVQYSIYGTSDTFDLLMNKDKQAGASAVQQAAAASLQDLATTPDPTEEGGREDTYVPIAYQRMLDQAVLGYSSPPDPSNPDATISLNSNLTYSWSNTNGVAPGTYDAVGALEHEISEALGRFATGGYLYITNNYGQKVKVYAPLDWFRYTAAGNGTNILPPGTAVGKRDEPYEQTANGYDPNAQSYFSYDGKTVLLPFDNITDVTAGADVGDWDPSVDNDSYGSAQPGETLLVSPTDLTVMNALGWDLAPVCFAAGTRVRTLCGEVAVEALTIGDVVVTGSGRRRPIRWLGQRTIDCRRHPRPALVWPIRIAAHAFGAGRPARDLRVSPGHAICVDVLGEVLIPAGALVDGDTIARVEVDTVTYWHVELDSHDLLLAEGLACESYLEMGNRAFFAGSGVVALAAVPDAPARTHADFCRPFHPCGPLVDAARGYLRGRAYRLTDAAAIRQIA